MAPRWTYIDPAIAFNPMISFQVVIMALLGGAGALWGRLLGAVPLVLLFEVLTAQLPERLLDPARRASSSSSSIAAARRDRPARRLAAARAADARRCRA